MARLRCAIAARTITGWSSDAIDSTNSAISPGTISTGGPS